MSKQWQQLDDEDHDDVASLFRRLDGRGERPGGYQVFSDVSPADRPAHAPSAARDSGPAPRDAMPAAGAPQAAPPAPQSAQPARPGTPLGQLFDRLAAAPPAMPGRSPLAKLLGK